MISPQPRKPKTALLYRSLGYFDAVRRYGSIREAARQLDTAASAINRQILKLEKEIGMPLFERLNDGMKLTPAGEIMARHVIAVLQDEKRAASELDGLLGLHRGEISLIAVESLNANFLPKIIEQMAEKYPGIRLKVQTAGSNSIPSAIIAGEADLGLAFSLARHAELRQLVVGRFKLGAVMRPDHALAQEAHVTFADCTKYRLLLPSRDLSIYSLLETQLRRFTFSGRLDVIAEVNSLELTRNLLLSLGGIAFQSRIGLERELSAGTLVHVPLSGAGALTTELGAYVRDGRSLPVALNALMSLVRNAITALEADQLAGGIPAT